VAEIDGQLKRFIVEARHFALMRKSKGASFSRPKLLRDQ
jgi:hypothetical protein